MKTDVTSDAALERVRRSCREADDPHELFERLSDDFHALIPHDGAVWFGADPATLLITSPVRVEGMEESACDPYWHYEFHVQDTAQFVDLARSSQPAAALRLSLDDRPARSARYRELLRPQGYDDELRSVMKSGDNTWGLLGLYRETGRRAFDSDDVSLISRASSIIGAALRDHVRAQSPWLGASRAPGLILFDRRSEVQSANSEALHWLRELVAEGETEDDEILDVRSAVEHILHDDAIERRSSPLWALISRSRAVAGGLDSRAARLRLRDRDGRWLVLHATTVSGRDEDADSVAIVIEPAKISEIAPIMIEAYSLTTRERDVVGALARGDTTSEIAAQLFLSPHTVRDHIKTIFEKLDVSSRAELVAKLYAEHHATPAHADIVHD